MAAAGRGREAEVFALLGNGADILLASRDGSTASGWAAKWGAIHPPPVITAQARCRTAPVGEREGSGTEERGMWQN